MKTKKFLEKVYQASAWREGYANADMIYEGKADLDALMSAITKDFEEQLVEPEGYSILFEMKPEEDEK